MPGQIDIGNAATEMADRMAAGTASQRRSRAEPLMDLTHVVNAVRYMAGLPLEANVEFMTVLATKMPSSAADNDDEGPVWLINRAARGSRSPPNSSNMPGTWPSKRSCSSKTFARLRSLWHSKGFATVAILCLGFGIGLNATIFSVVDGVLLKPYPYADPDRILIVGEQNPRRRQPGRAVVSRPARLEGGQLGLHDDAGVASRSLTISDRGGEPERYLGAARVIGPVSAAGDGADSAGAASPQRTIARVPVRSSCSASICGPADIAADPRIIGSRS